MTGYILPPEPPLDPPDDEAEDNRKTRHQQALIAQAEDDLWHENHPNTTGDY